MTCDRNLVLPSAARLVLAAGDTIPNTYSTVFIEGSGGAVVLTSTPTIETAGAADGQTIIVIGQDDVNTVTLQDETVLAGSALRQHAQGNLIYNEWFGAAYVFDAVRAEWVQYAFRSSG